MFVIFALLSVLVGCRVVSLDRSLERPEERLRLYEAVLRTITAQFAVGKRPPVERQLVAWRPPLDSLRVPSVEPPAYLLALPDSFVNRLAREGITGGVCPPEGCRRVPDAITLSAPNARDSVVFVQASLAGTGLEQYVMRRGRDLRWSVVRREQLLEY